MSSVYPQAMWQVADRRVDGQSRISAHHYFCDWTRVGGFATAYKMNCAWQPQYRRYTYVESKPSLCQSLNDCDHDTQYTDG